MESKIKDIIDNYYDYLFSLENVNGIGYGYKYKKKVNTLEPCIQVFVDNKINIKNLSSKNIIPNKYMGIKTDVIKTKNLGYKEGFNANYFPIEPKKIRPLEGGCEISNSKVGYLGTVCCIVKRQNDYYILSNNHVLCNFNEYPIGTEYVQPSIGSDVNNIKQNKIAVLKTFIPLKPMKYEGYTKAINIVDCGIAKLIDNSLISDRVREIGVIKGTKKAEVGMNIRKVGAVTGLTYGEVFSTNVTTFLNSPIGRCYFKKQIYIDIETAPGDSGAPMVTDDNYIIGMHSARKTTEDDETLSLTNDINTVLGRLNVKLYLGEL